MGDTATEIDLDSVIDRLLEGECLVSALCSGWEKAAVGRWNGDGGRYRQNGGPRLPFCCVLWRNRYGRLPSDVSFAAPAVVSLWAHSYG